MNTSENIGRWPPVYDFAELGQQIKNLINDGSIFSQFYHSNTIEPNLCQGDIISLKQTPIYIDKDGDVAEIDEEYSHWIILGNTCDLSRELSTDSSSSIPQLTHISPLIPIPKDTPSNVLDSLKKYKLFKKVLIPKWKADDDNDYYLDLTIIIPIEKQCLSLHSTVTARLKFETWLLLHSCLVRYLARDDGRHD